MILCVCAYSATPIPTQQITQSVAIGMNCTFWAQFNRIGRNDFWFFLAKETQRVAVEMPQNVKFQENWIQNY